MSNQPEFERQLANIIFPGFPDNADERADVVRQIMALAERTMPRACQSTSHSPFACWYGFTKRVWQCTRCERWFCWHEGDTFNCPDTCGTCRDNAAQNN